MITVGILKFNYYLGQNKILMKTFLSIFIVSAIALGGCTKSSNSSSSSTATMTAAMTYTSYDTVTKSSIVTDTSFTAVTCHAADSGDFYLITGTPSWGTYITLSVPRAVSGNLAETTYAISFSTSSDFPAWATYGAKAAQSGTITILSLDPGVSLTGRFSFVRRDIEDSVVINNGQFNATF